MHPSASPRHPWRALGAVIAMLAVVHGVWPHDSRHDHGFGHVHVVDSSDDGDCPDIDVHIDDDPDEGAVIDVFDGDDWA